MLNKAEGFHLWLQSDPLFPDLPGRCTPMTLECRAGEANPLIEIGAQLGDPAYSHPQASSGGKTDSRIGITGDFPLLSVHAYFFHFPRGGG